MEVKAKLDEIHKQSPMSIKGLIALDISNWANPNEYFYRIENVPYHQQSHIFKFKSFRFLNEHLDIFSAKLAEYNNGVAPSSMKSVWDAFCKAAIEIQKEIDSKF